MKGPEYQTRPVLALLYAIFRGVSPDDAMRFVGGIKANERGSQGRVKQRRARK